MLAAVRVYWTEYEAGWGSRPDGATLHRDEEEAKRYIKAYWDSMPDRSKGVPECYSSPGEPQLIRVTQEEYDRAQKEGSFWR